MLTTTVESTSTYLNIVQVECKYVLECMYKFESSQKDESRVTPHNHTENVMLLTMQSLSETQHSLIFGF